MTFAAFFSLVAPSAALVALLAVGAFRPLRPYSRFITAGGAVLSLLGVLAVRFDPSQAILLSRWSPEVLFGLSPILRTEPRLWPLAIAVSAAVAGSSLAQLARRARPPLGLELAALGGLTAMLGCLWGDNPLTVLLFWGLFDLAWTVGLVACGAETSRLSWGVGSALAATASLWAGTLMLGAQGSLASWDLALVSGPGRTLLIVSAILRLGLYPAHASLFSAESTNLPLSSFLLLGPILGWKVLLHVLSPGAEGQPAVPAWAVGMGLASWVVGSFLAWTRPDRTRSIPWITVAANGLLLAAGSKSPQVLELAAASWALGATLVGLAGGRTPGAWWWAVPSTIGGLALLALPPWPIFGAATLLAGEATSNANLTLGSLLLVGEALLTATVARHLLQAAGDSSERGVLERIARGAGEGLPALALLIAAVAALLPDRVSVWAGRAAGGVLGGWALWGVGLAAGAGLYWAERRRERRPLASLALVSDVVDLEWLYSLILGGFGRASHFLRTMAQLTEGAGAVFWALALFLLLLLFLT